MPATSEGLDYNPFMRRKHWLAIIFVELAVCIITAILLYRVFIAPEPANSPTIPIQPTRLSATSSSGSMYVTVELRPTLAPLITGTLGPPAPTPLPSTYTVGQGDTLWDIAVRFNLDIETLIAANPTLNPDYLMPGDVILLSPGAAAPTPVVEATPFGPVTAQVSPDGGGLRLREGPGLSQPIITMLDAQTPLTLIGRTENKGWLQVITPRGDSGWVMARWVEVFVALDTIPVTGEVVSAPTPESGGTSTLPTPPGEAISYLYITNITEHARQLFLFGQSLGNRPGVFSKVGDSITASTEFLNPIGYGDYNLRGHSNLQPVIDYFSQAIARDANSFASTSLAAKVGWPAQAVLSPKAADLNDCLPGESPLVCEYRWVRPSVALIMLGTNDVPGTSEDRYERHMREVIEISIEMGVVPVVSTLPPIHRAGTEGRVELLNGVVTKLAHEYEIPLWDYWSALKGLPDDGLISDGVHPSAAPNSADFTPENLQYGMTVRNLTALQALDAVWRGAMYP